MKKYIRIVLLAGAAAGIVLAPRSVNAMMGGKFGGMVPKVFKEPTQAEKDEALKQRAINDLEKKAKSNDPVMRRGAEDALTILKKSKEESASSDIRNQNQNAIVAKYGQKEDAQTVNRYLGKQDQARYANISKLEAEKTGLQRTLDKVGAPKSDYEQAARQGVIQRINQLSNKIEIEKTATLAKAQAREKSIKTSMMLTGLGLLIGGLVSVIVHYSVEASNKSKGGGDGKPSAPTTAATPIAAPAPIIVDATTGQTVNYEPEIVVIHQQLLFGRSLTDKEMTELSDLLRQQKKLKADYEQLIAAIFNRQDPATDDENQQIQQIESDYTLISKMFFMKELDIRYELDRTADRRDLVPDYTIVLQQLTNLYNSLSNDAQSSQNLTDDEKMAQMAAIIDVSSEIAYVNALINLETEANGIIADLGMTSSLTAEEKMAQFNQRYQDQRQAMYEAMLQDVNFFPRSDAEPFENSKTRIARLFLQQGMSSDLSVDVDQPQM